MTVEIPDSTDKAVTAEKLEKHLSDFTSLGFDWMDVRHRIGGGLYTRTGILRAGQVAIGTEHRQRNIFHLACGKLALWDNFNGCRIVTGPYSEISVPGMRRMAIALTDCEGSNIFETQAANWEQAEAEMFHPLTLPQSVGTKLLTLAEHCGVTLSILNENPTKS